MFQLNSVLITNCWEIQLSIFLQKNLYKSFPIVHFRGFIINKVYFLINFRLASQNDFHSRFTIKNHQFLQFSITISCLSESFCACWSVISMIFFWAKDHNVATSHCCGINSPECPFLKIGIQNFSIKIPFGRDVASFLVRYTASSFERK